jgi:hypothetical protein
MLLDGAEDPILLGSPLGSQAIEGTSINPTVEPPLQDSIFLLQSVDRFSVQPPGISETLVERRREPFQEAVV